MGAVTPGVSAQEAAGATGGYPSVVVAVLTYRRPRDLAALLPMLVEQVDRYAGAAEVLVVDNDPAGSARSAVADVPGPVRYVHEPQPGIAVARNRALDEAGADLLVFIDDDERPVERWLELMLAVYLTDRPAAVVGSVVPEYEGEPHAWVRDGRFFQRPRLPTGTLVEAAGSGNLLLDLHQVRELDVRFDERFSLTGGSDTLFTRQLTHRGGRMVWCDEATIVDMVPAARATPRWVLARAYRSGNVWTRTSVELAGAPARRVAVRVAATGRGVLRLGGGAARWLLGAVSRSRVHRARGLRTVARGAGMAAGSWGHVYTEYRR